MKKKKFKWKKLLIILGIVAVLIILIYSCSRKTADAAMMREEVKARDIKTYHSFSGTVTPVNEQKVYADVTGIKVKSLAAEVGDTVKAGDPLVYLDTSSIEDQIRQQEISMSVNTASSGLSVAQAKANYENFRNAINNGTNSQILAAQQTLANAESQLNTAQKNYDKEVSANAAGNAQIIVSADTQVSSSYEQVRLAEIAFETADHNCRQAVGEEAEFLAKQAYEQAEHSLQSALVAYELARWNADEARRNEDAAISGYYDQLVAAQNSYAAALTSLNATRASVNETLATYKTQYEQALASANTELSDLQLKKLYEQLDQCTIKAPMSGVVTSLDLKEGDMVTANAPVAVVTEFGKMKIDISINEYDLAETKEGDEVEITLNAFEKDYKGTITKIARTATVQNGVSYFASVVEFDADDDVRGGMSVEVRIIKNDLKSVTAVPARAVQTKSDGTSYVMVIGADGKTTEMRDVECGATDGTYIEIKKGLKNGETVMYSAQTIEEMTEALMGM
ncbi:MAG: efflux RND transporter periplasmic adaptor subunit [Lachnospiraceae bacterium]|nr:efflux RND transporter periplasmic adaptor subunit [Lachnospiraceae bacterium]